MPNIRSRQTYTSDGGGGGQTSASANLKQAGQRLSQQAVTPKPVVQQAVGGLNRQGGGAQYTPKLVGAGASDNIAMHSSAYSNNSNNNSGSGYRGGGSGGGTVEAGGGGYGGGSSYSGPSYEDIIKKIQDLLTEQKNQADAYYKTLYEKQLSDNKQSWEDNRNQINRNYARTNRLINSMYGDAVSGQGLSNRSRNYTNWNNNLSENQRNYTNNNATALASYNQGLANNASTLAQGWYNYVLPVYTNRQQNLDDLDYRRYIASLNLR